MAIYEDFFEFDTYFGNDELPFSHLEGKTLKAVLQDGEDAIYFHTTDDKVYKMFHIQSCCESVYIEDIVGDLQSLIGDPIQVASETSNERRDSDIKHSTWTYYNIYTMNGDVNIRWYGTSNGYYSERVSLVAGRPKK